jgi:hypothetical protein
MAQPIALVASPVAKFMTGATSDVTAAGSALT